MKADAAVYDAGLLSVKAAAAFLHVSERRIRDLLRDNAIESVSLGPHSTRVPKSALVAYIERLSRDNE